MNDGLEISVKNADTMKKLAEKKFDDSGVGKWGVASWHYEGGSPFVMIEFRNPRRGVQGWSILAQSGFTVDEGRYVSHPRVQFYGMVTLLSLDILTEVMSLMPSKTMREFT